MSSSVLKQRYVAVDRHEQGQSEHKIAHDMGRSVHFVSKAIERDELTGVQQDLPRSGRPKKITRPISTKLIELTKAKRHRSSRKVAGIAKQRKIASVSYTTVQREWKKKNMKPFRRPKKPRMTEARKKKRMTFARENLNTDWTKYVFTDEKKFVLFEEPNSKNDIVWALDPSEVSVVEQEKWKIVVHTWGAIGYNGQICLVFYEPSLNAKGYQELLENHFIPAAKAKLKKSNYVFQQDGATCHTAVTTQRWLEENVPEFVPKESWPPNSPDLNPIERIWAILAEKLSERRPRTITGFKKIIREEWMKLPLRTFRALIDDLPNKIRLVIEKRGCAL